jgi:hypothetical protein
MSSLVCDKRVERRQLAFVRRVLGLFRSALREIFEESAYERFLEREGKASSQAAYAEFLREGQAARERQTRCC